MVDVGSELGIEGVLSELLFADDLILMYETIKGHQSKFINWKETFESNGFRINFGRTKVMVSGGIKMDGLFNSKVDLCVVCSLRVKANSVLCVVW